MVDLEQFILTEDEVSDRVDLPPDRKPLRWYAHNKKSPFWVTAGLSRDAIWAWDIFAMYWRRWRRRCSNRVPINAEVKRMVGVRDSRQFARILRELEHFGLIEVDRKAGRNHRLTFVDISGTAIPPGYED